MLLGIKQVLIALPLKTSIPSTRSKMLGIISGAAGVGVSPPTDI